MGMENKKRSERHWHCTESVREMALEEWGKLEGKVVMVTGASSGLGLDFCLDLAKAGCKIIAAARRVDRLQSLCHQINHLYSSSSPRAVAVELDLCADGLTIDKSIQKAWDVFGHIHALVNNAGFRGYQLKKKKSVVLLGILCVFLTFASSSLF